MLRHKIEKYQNKIISLKLKNYQHGGVNPRVPSTTTDIGQQLSSYKSKLAEYLKIGETNPYGIFGIAESTPYDEVVAKYNKLLSEYELSKVPMVNGVPDPEIQKVFSDIKNSLEKAFNQFKINYESKKKQFEEEKKKKEKEEKTQVKIKNKEISLNIDSELMRVKPLGNDYVKIFSLSNNYYKDFDLDKAFIQMEKIKKMVDSANATNDPVIKSTADNLMTIYDTAYKDLLKAFKLKNFGFYDEKLVKYQKIILYFSRIAGNSGRLFDADLSKQYKVFGLDPHDTPKKMEDTMDKTISEITNDPDYNGTKYSPILNEIYKIYEKAKRYIREDIDKETKNEKDRLDKETKIKNEKDRLEKLQKEKKYYKILGLMKMYQKKI